MIDDSAKARAFIASVIALGIVGLAVALFFLSPPPASLQVLTGLLSALTLALGAVVQFYFGSSSGARTLVAAQSQTVKTLAEAVATSVPAGVALAATATAAPTGTPDDPVSVVTEPPAPPKPPAPSAPTAIDTPFAKVDAPAPVEPPTVAQMLSDPNLAPALAVALASLRSRHVDIDPTRAAP